jgi:hypothetical protein
LTYATAFHAATGRAPEGFAEVLVISDETRQAKVYYNVDAKEIVIGFDCTKGTPWPPSLDWIENLKAWPKSFSVGSEKYKAHAGFVEEYLTMRDQIKRYVLIHQPEVIRITGFSQGSAHATLCHRDLVELFDGMEIHTVVFASPRVYTYQSSFEFEKELGDGSFLHTFERINLWGDPVPSLPQWFLGYRHVGPVKRIGPFKLIVDPSVHNGESYLNAL